MVLAVVDGHLDVVHPVARDRARLEDLADPLLHRGNELRRDDPAHDVVDELEALPAPLRLDPQEDLAELPGAAGLLLVAVVPLGGGGDRLAVRDARRAGLHLDVVALLHPLEHHSKVQLPETADHRLAGRGAVLDLEARVFGRQLREGVGELLLVSAGLRLDGKPVHRLGQGHRRRPRHVAARGVQHRSVADLVHLRDGADVARHAFVDLHVVLALEAKEVSHLEGLAPVVDVELGVAGHRAGVDAERGELADEGVDGHPEDLRHHRGVGVGLDLDRVSVRGGERPRVRFGRARHEPGEHVEQQLDAGPRSRRDEAHRNEVPLPERGPERAAELVRGDLSLLQELLHQLLVHLHRLVHDPALRFLDGGELGGGGRIGVEEAVDDLLAAGGREVDGETLGPEHLLEARDEGREVEVRRVDLVHDDEAREAAGRRRLHHPAGGGLDPGPRVDDDGGRLHRGEGGKGPPEEVRIPRGVHEGDVGRIVVETRDRVPQRLLVGALLGLVVAYRGALLHRARGPDGPRRRQQRLDDRGLAAAAVPDDRDVANLPRGVIRHPGSPMRSRRRTVEYIPRRPLRKTHSGANRSPTRWTVSRGARGAGTPASASPRGGFGCAGTRTRPAPSGRARRAERRPRPRGSPAGRRARRRG